MIRAPSKCGFVTRSHCKTCGRWGGWIGEGPTQEDLRKMQKDHDALWNKQIEQMKVMS